MRKGKQRRCCLRCLTRHYDRGEPRTSMPVRYTYSSNSIFHRQTGIFLASVRSNHVGGCHSVVVTNKGHILHFGSNSRQPRDRQLFPDDREPRRILQPNADDSDEEETRRRKKAGSSKVKYSSLTIENKGT